VSSCGPAALRAQVDACRAPVRCLLGAGRRPQRQGKKFLNSSFECPGRRSGEVRGADAAGQIWQPPGP